MDFVLGNSELLCFTPGIAKHDLQVTDCISYLNMMFAMGNVQGNKDDQGISKPESNKTPIITEFIINKEWLKWPGYSNSIRTRFRRDSWEDMDTRRTCIYSVALGVAGELLESGYSEVCVDHYFINYVTALFTIDATYVEINKVKIVQKMSKLLLGDVMEILP